MMWLTTTYCALSTRVALRVRVQYSLYLHVVRSCEIQWSVCPALGALVSLLGSAYSMTGVKINRRSDARHT